MLCLAEFMRKKMKDSIPEYYFIIAEEVTDQFPNFAFILHFKFYIP